MKISVHSFNYGDGSANSLDNLNRQYIFIHFQFFTFYMLILLINLLFLFCKIRFEVNPSWNTRKGSRTNTEYKLDSASIAKVLSYWLEIFNCTSTSPVYTKSTIWLYADMWRFSYHSYR